MDAHRTPLEAALALCLLAACIFTASCDITDDFPYHDQLDEKFLMKWNFNSTHIAFNLKVETTGWVGFGVSNHGDMHPGDMVIAWMSGETVHFHDRYATDRSMPKVDTQQDWDLVDFERENNTYTLTVVRKLDTCDAEHDIAIEDSTSRVIYAYNDAVPSSDSSILYHGPSTRGTKSILLLDPPPIEGVANEMPDDVITVDFVNENYTVPAIDTTYSCTLLKFPELQKKHHIIRYEPMIQKGHEKLVHHILLYACTMPKNESLLDRAYHCYDSGKEIDDSSCYHVMIAWGIGGTGFNYPAHVGHSMGTPEDPVYFKLETHYDNVGLRNDFVDSSGIRLHLTTELRQYDAGMLEVGTLVSRLHIIPPHMDDFKTRGYCPSSCIDKGLEEEGEIKLFADFLHSHLLGRKMAARHVRNGKELPPIAKDDHYDFNYQETRALPEERVVKKGDSLIMDCHYDSTKRTGVTYGGLESQEEMCLAFILYYPRVSLGGCLTRLTYSSNLKPFYTDEESKNLNFEVGSVRQEFANNVQKSDQTYYCRYSNSGFKQSKISPLEYTEYVPTSECESEPGNGGETPAKPFGFLSVWFAFLLQLFRRAG